MKRILIDTNIYSHALRGSPEIVDVLRQVNEICMSVISIGELLSGFKGGNREAGNKRELEEFLDTPRVRILYVDENTAEFYADVLNRLKIKGTPIPTNDIWIAATAQQHGLKLFSLDRHFENVPGLLLLNRY
jgi:tRNA(fMet)-specific endonuclease VapC